MGIRYLPGNVAAHRFVMLSWCHEPTIELSGAGTDADAVTMPASDDLVAGGGIRLHGMWRATPADLAHVEAAEPLAVGDEIASDADGRAVRARGTAIVVATALSAVTSAGQLITIRWSSEIRTRAPSRTTGPGARDMHRASGGA